MSTNLSDDVITGSGNGLVPSGRNKMTTIAEYI